MEEEGGCYGVTSPVISLEFLDVDDAGHTKLLIDVISRDPDCVSKRSYRRAHIQPAANKI